MTIKIKKVLLFVTLFALLLSLNVNAQELFSVEVPSEFYTKSESPKKVAEILNIKDSELYNYCAENNVAYFAVNGNNTKQIKITVNENEFSKKIINFANLTDEEILGLTQEIVGIENVVGDIVDLNGQKFLKVEFSSKDSGGEYILTQYITTCQKQNVIISFYTNSNLDSDFTREIFQTITSPMFIQNGLATLKAFSVAIPFVTIAFVLICVALVGSIIIDVIQQKKRAEEDEEDFEESPKNE